jgi:mono/diheme cytochrome c family protein
MAPAADGPKADMSKVPAASDKKDVSFDADIEPIFKASCLGCHTPGTRPARGGLDLSTKAGVLKGGRGKNDLVVGHSDQSNIVLFTSDAVAKSEMPPLSARTRATNPEPALTKDQIGLIRAWIDQGAK